MKITSINLVFARIAKWQIKHRVALLAGLLAFTILTCAGLPRLKLSSNEEEWFDDLSQIKIDQDNFEQLFGSQDSFMVLVRSENVFSKECLSAIKRLSERLENEVPYADKVTSLTTNLSIPQATQDGFEMVSPFDDGIPENPAEISEKAEFILSRESLVNKIISDDCKETWISLSFEPYEGGLDYAQTNIVPHIRNILFSGEFDSDDYELLPTGMSYTEYEETEVTNHECTVRIIIGFIVMVLCLILFVRSLRGVIVPTIATICGIASVMGINAWLGIAGDAAMVALPVLLGMALSVGYTIHYVNEFRLFFRRSGKRKQSVIQAVEETGWPILFTVITTVASLISFLFAGIRPLRWVGGISAAIVFSVFVYVIICIPIFLSFGKDRVPDSSTQENAGSTKTDVLFGRAGGWLLKHSKSITIVCSLVMILQIPGLFKMKVNMDYTETMGKKIPYVARLLDMLSGKLGSLYDYNVMIEFDDDDALKNPENMKKIEQMETFLGNLEMTKVSNGKPRVSSLLEMVKEMNRTLNDDDKSFYAIPDEEDMLTQLLFLYEITDADSLYSQMDADYKTTFIHVELNGYDASKMVDELAQIKQKGNEIFAGVAKTSVVGEVVNYAEMNGKIVTGELKSFAGSFIIIAILLILAFTGIKTGLIAMIPNIAPVLFIGGIMGYFKMSLDMITMTVMPMILGIAVDDTIHMVNHIKSKLEQGYDYKNAIILTFREIGKTMAMTTLILCAMFFVFIFSPMTALSRIGILSIAGLLGALGADYTLTPLLIYILKPYKKNKN